MFLKFTPKGAAEPQIYEIQPGKTPRKRAAIAEKVYSKAVGERRTWQQLQADAQQGSIEAWTVLLWVAMCAEHPMLRYDDIEDFESDALVMEHSKEEVRRMLAAIRSTTTMLDNEKEAILAQLEAALETAPVGSDEPDPNPDPAVAEPVDAEGKAPDTTDGSSTI